MYDSNLGDQPTNIRFICQTIRPDRFCPARPSFPTRYTKGTLAQEGGRVRKRKKNTRHGGITAEMGLVIIVLNLKLPSIKRLPGKSCRKEVVTGLEYRRFQEFPMDIVRFPNPNLPALPEFAFIQEYTIGMITFPKAGLLPLFVIPAGLKRCPVFMIPGPIPDHFTLYKMSNRLQGTWE